MLGSTALPLLCSLSAYTGKTDPVGPRLWVTAMKSAHVGLPAAKRPAQPWEGSAGSWAALAQVQSRENGSHRLGRFLL